ncbi:MAG: threonine/serine exporter family protein [Mogibacterium sp.]|nr:threonine/serine exporter family protein [Mogibacterium sp.]
MSKTERVLEFCIELGRRMIIAGANLERVELAMQLICRAYGFLDVSIFLLSSHISVGVMDKDGNYYSRQVNVPPAGIHLEKLKRLNRLSYTVVNEVPDPDKLPEMMEEASAAREYGRMVILAARVAAMICLCLIFGGGIREVAATVVITVLIEFVGRFMQRIDVNRLVSSAAIMCIATVMIMILYVTGLCSKAPVLIITITMIFLPGIPLVNAVRNLVCDHEMNGLLQLMRVFVETAALGIGIYAAIYLFRGSMGLGDQALNTLKDPVLLIILSFGASVGFGMVFQIPPHDLWRAGVGGVLTRIVLIFLPGVLPYRIVYTGLAALTAALYAEFLASKRKDPSTYFVYPAIIPLIPGDMFFHMILGILYNNWDMALTNGAGCFVALLGMSIGFVLSSSVAHYIRKMRHEVHLNRFVPKVPTIRITK